LPGKVGVFVLLPAGGVLFHFLAYWH
jgi:hypothetical protein